MPMVSPGRCHRSADTLFLCPIEHTSQRGGSKWRVSQCHPTAAGTATLHGALLGAGVGVGDEVIVPSFTPFPTGAAVLCEFPTLPWTFGPSKPPL